MPSLVEATHALAASIDKLTRLVGAARLQLLAIVEARREPMAMGKNRALLVFQSRIGELDLRSYHLRGETNFWIYKESSQS